MSFSLRLRLAVALPQAIALFTACNFPRPADVAGEAGPSDASVSDGIAPDGPPIGGPPIDGPPIDTAPDAPDPPGTVLHVSPTGDDANDGLTLPVKTLKHAIGLAAANSTLRSIVLASGRYSSAGGETFPYTVPANVSIVGPAGGGAILAGSNVETGMTIVTGELKDLELEDFTVAIVTTGVAHVANIHVRTSVTAVRAETTSRLTIDNLDVTGTLAACAAGIVLNGAAELSATTFATRNLGTALDTKDQSVAHLVSANIVGDANCTQAIIRVTTNQTFSLSDSTLDGGNGITIGPGSQSVQVTLTNSILRNMKSDAIAGGPDFNGSLTFKMTGGELSGNARGGAEIGGGSWTFEGVRITQNPVFGIYFQDGILVMRGCTVRSNGDGVYLLTPVAADLGTVTDPGNNTLQDNSNLNLDYDSSRIQVEAVGNIWNANVQGADGFGRYPPEVLQGHIAIVPHNNYAIGCDPGQCTLHR